MQLTFWWGQCTVSGTELLPAGGEENRTLSKEGGSEAHAKGPFWSANAADPLGRSSHVTHSNLRITAATERLSLMREWYSCEELGDGDAELVTLWAVVAHGPVPWLPLPKTKTK